MKIVESIIPYNYITVRTTKSRINKGLLAIPVSLIEYFPQNKVEIFIADLDKNYSAKTYTPYSSSSRECRIGGLKEFYNKNDIQDGDEIVIQLIEKDNKYRLIPEKNWLNDIFDCENILLNSSSDEEFSTSIQKISKLTLQKERSVIESEYLRLTSLLPSKRELKKDSPKNIKTNVTPSIKNFLLNLYHGKCQLTNFTFEMKNKNPYFEIHHINPNIGHHFKNLLVVCPNIHAQFTYANVQHFYDSEGWLRKVIFNDIEYQVHQIIDSINDTFFKNYHF